MVEELPNLFDAVRKANRAAWEQASGRKSPDESRQIPPATGRETLIEGADASAIVSALSAKLSSLQARVDYIEDDFPEREGYSGEGGGGGYTYSLSVKAVSGYLITCSGGHWTHRTTANAIAAATFWLGDAGDAPAGATVLADGEWYISVEVPSCTWVASGASGETPPEYPSSGTKYLRRAILHIAAPGEGLSLYDRVTALNAGDVYT